MSYGDASPPPDPSLFNSSVADAAGAGHTYAYAFILGPDSNGATTQDEAYTWRVSQADIAANGRLHAPSSVERVTLFADIEGTPGTNGWNSFDLTLNQKVWEGFVSETSSNGLSCRLYSTSIQWSGIMGPGYGVPIGTAVWSANSSNQPCGACPTSLPNLPAIGGVTPSI